MRERFGQLCTVEWMNKVVRVCYYATRPYFYLELLRRDYGEYAKHLFVLVGPDGEPLPIPEGSRLVHLESGEEQDLLERVVSQQVRS